MRQKKPGEKSTTKKNSKKKLSSTPTVDFLATPQSIESLLRGFGGRQKGRSALDEAQEIMYDAWEATSRKRAVELARKALTVSADCADAYVFLAGVTAKTPQEVIDLYRQGVEAGERALGKKAFKEDVGHFWGLLETRPYMRARAGLAQSLWEAGQREDAVDHYWDLLRLNPNDNQGVRDMLMPCLIELNRDKDAEKLYKQYEDDHMAVWTYSRALLDFRKHRESPTADKSLEAAIERNKHVPLYLLGRKKVPRSLPGHYGMGDDNEAVLYASANHAAWRSTPGALEWLAAKVK
jgi:tetratricopeptide (TPR) repeat protein